MRSKWHTLLILPVMFSLLFIMNCSVGTISVDETYSTLRPVKQLELPEQVTDNLVIEISNVADLGSSYKNRVDVFVNDKKIKPNWVLTNVEETYIYKLRLRPGYYKVKSHYYAYIGWGEEKYIIESQDLVKVYADKRNYVTCDIVKKPNGEPVNQKMYFKQRIEPLNSTVQSTKDLTKF